MASLYSEKCTNIISSRDNIVQKRDKNEHRNNLIIRTRPDIIMQKLYDRGMIRICK